MQFLKFLQVFLVLYSNMAVQAQIYHSGHITSHETWSSGSNPHIITDHLYVDENVWLDIQPGCDVRFDGNYFFEVNGRLIADGTSSNPIIFTSNSLTPDKGDWKSIYFNAPETGSVLNYCEISYGGDDHANVYLDSTLANINITNCIIKWSEGDGIFIATSSSPIIDNCTIQENEEHGIHVANISAYQSYPVISNCTITYSGVYAIKTHGDNAKDIIPPMVITNNYLNSIYLGVEDLHTGTWTDFDIPYIIDGNLILLDGETLTIEPGNILQFEMGHSLEIRGKLIAQGEQSNVITFTSNQPTPAPGDWRQIYFNEPDPGCIFEYCNVWYGGMGGNTGNIELNNTGTNVNLTQITSSYSYNAGLFITTNSSPTIYYCSFLNNNEEGIVVVNTPTLPSYPIMIGCFVENNGGYGIKTHGNNVKDMSWPIILTGNGINAILLWGSDLTTGTWTNFGVPYILANDQSVLDGETLTLAQGCTIKFNDDYVFDVYGTLMAEGTAENPITFTSNEPIPAPGDWRNIHFQEPDTGCLLNHCIVDYGGSFRGNIYMSNAQYNVTISNCEITNSANSGIYGLNNSSPIIINTIIENNTDHGFLLTPYQYLVTPSLTNCIIRNNGDNGIKIKENVDMQFGNDLSEWNDIYDNGLYNIYNENPNDVDAQYVYWGTTDSAQISAGIYDYNEDIDFGVVKFNPWTNTTHDSLFPGAPVILDLKVFLEGPFNGAAMNTSINEAGFVPLSQPYNTAPWNYTGTESVPTVPVDVVDWVLVELRDAVDAGSADPSTMIEQQAGLLLNNGQVVGLDGDNMRWIMPDEIENNLFVVVWHRNHLGVISSDAVTESGGLYIYDFTQPEGQAFGANSQVSLGNDAYGLISGDGDANGIIDSYDNASVWTTNAGGSGYLQGDYNLDGQQDNPDKDAYWLMNKDKFTKIPE